MIAIVVTKDIIYLELICEQGSDFDWEDWWTKE